MSSMDVSNGNQLQLAISAPSPSYGDMLESQRELFHSQIGELQNIVLAQCELTGVNPLSQEMAAGALSIKIGKRPRDLLNPKAVKYMQSVFSIKDAINKRESREISALFGVTVTQVREFFMSQRSRVRKFVRVARQKAIIADASNEVQNETPISMDAEAPVYPVPLSCVGPSGGEVPSCSPQYESLPELDDSDRYFVENIFAFMRKEESFSGQVKLMDWILQIHNSSLLFWFLSRGGVMVLATWLSQAASEEQTSVLHVILKVLCHLPLNKALPEQMSAILHSVNRLRFYPVSDISNRARFLLSRWSKLFARSQAMKKQNAVKSAVDTPNELLLKQSIDEIMGDESWESKNNCHEDGLDGSENVRKLESSQPLKLLPASADDYSKKFIRGVSSSQTRERRKVLLMEQPGHKSFGRSTQVARAVPANQSRPLSADDIQKAKLRAQFMQQKYGKTGASSGEGHQVKVEAGNKVLFPQAKAAKVLLPPPQAQEQKEPLVLSSKAPPVQKEESPLLISSEVSVQPEVPSSMPSDEVSVQVETPRVVDKMDLDLDEPLWRRCKRVQIQWHTPAEVKLHEDWGVGNGVDSKEVDIQKNRIRREKETVYPTPEDIPSDPKEPWDREMDYDDTLTLNIPIEQPPEPDNTETVVSPPPQAGSSSVAPPPPPLVPPQNTHGSFPEPDLELLAELLKTPELVFALTAGQGGGSLSNDDIVKLLDLIKTNGVDSVVGSFSSMANVQVSLPSPTPPSSDPVTSGWRPETAVNPFSRRTAAYSGGAQFRQTPATQPPQAASRLPPAGNFAPGSHHQPVNFQSTVAGSYGSPISQHPQNSELGNNSMRNNRSQLNSGYNTPVPTVNRQQQPVTSYHHHPDAAMLHSPTPPRAQPQPPPHLMTPSQRANPYSRPNNNSNQQHNYNAFVGGPMNPPRDGGRFQPWGPEDNPNRYNEQVVDWRYQRPAQHSNRAEPGRWNPSEYRDFERHGNDQRWRDHRRR